MVIGERLKMARKMNGLSQQELGEKAGVSRMSISKYERDINVPRSQVLIKLAQALDVKIEYLLRPVEVHLSEPVFRKRTALPKKQEYKILERTRDWVERYLHVEALFRASPAFIRPDIDNEIHRMEDVEEAALQLRDEWQLGLDPIDHLIEILEDKGIKVFVINQSVDHFDALIMWVNEEVPIIVVKSGIPGDRQRFNLAHELAHLLLNIDETLDEEKAAHRFAGAFLVPRPKVYEELGRNRQHLGTAELIMLKHKYGLSMQAWIFRAKDLGVISDSKFKQLFINIRKQNWHEQEPGEQIDPERPLRMKQLVLRALAEDVISRPRAEELLQESITGLEGEEI
jgi:Zn-dependent peptidase ImmA (M78 family)/DNA-binding XRE family transcriptional regulator